MCNRKEVKMLLKFTLFLVVCAFCSAEDPPSFVKKCNYGDLECFVNSANDILINHSHELDKIHFKDTDPFRQGELDVGEEDNRPIRVNFHLKENLIYGLNGMRFNRAVGWEEDINNSKFEIYGHNTYLNITGKYQVDGRILLLPIQGKGDYNMLLEGITFGVRVKGEEIIKNGKKHMKVKKLKLLLDPSKFNIKLSNLFDGNDELSRSLVKVINENWRDAWDEVAPSVFAIIDSIMKDLWQDFFDAFPYEDLFLHEK